MFTYPGFIMVLGILTDLSDNILEASYFNLGLISMIKYLLSAFCINWNSWSQFIISSLSLTNGSLVGVSGNFIGPSTEVIKASTPLSLSTSIFSTLTFSNVVSFNCSLYRASNLWFKSASSFFTSLIYKTHSQCFICSDQLSQIYFNI